ncbi:MAG: helix-turn-helix domain-containing protein [Clostridia bacterium]|nr:helix-turn-helix domain-containing protein [Clostridia bacterium]
MHIGRNIYELRKQKGLTQAQLAEKMGVTEQAVSKWENEISTPDVSLFPVLANFFGVSIDRLYGFHLDSYDREVEKICRESDAAGDTYREIEILTKGLEKYPNSEELKINLAFSLSMVNRISEDEKEKREAVDKAVRLCEEVIAVSGREKYRDDAWHMLSRIYTETGAYTKALEAVSRIGADGYFYRLVGTVNALRFSKQYAEQIAFAETNLWKCLRAMHKMMDSLAGTLMETGDCARAAAFYRADAVLLSVFDEGCVDFEVCAKLFSCLGLAHCFKKSGDRENCLAQLEKLAELAEQAGRAAECREGDDWYIHVRNPLYFAHDPDIHEEYVSGFPAAAVMESFRGFMEADEAGAEAFRKLLARCGE